MRSFGLAVCLLLVSPLIRQVYVRGDDSSDDGEDWDTEYTIKHVPPHRRSYIYRAYRDAPEDKLVLFGEVREDVADEVTECVVHPFEEDSFSLPAAVTRLPFGHGQMSRTLRQRVFALEEFVPIRVECGLQERPGFKYAAAALKAGDEVLAGVSEVVDVITERVGQIAACVGPLVSGQLSREWLKYHESLGVDRFFSFVPSGKEYTDGKYNIGGDIPHSILDYLQWSGKFRPEAVTLTPRPSVQYMIYSPTATSFYFGQFAMMHACWYEQRYAYDFVLDTDTDEYIWLNMTVTGQRKPLHLMLDSVPANAATVTLSRYTYPPQCQPSGEGVPLVERAIVRTANPDFQPKMILRPRGLQVATNHVPVEVREGYERTFEPGKHVWIKHIRPNGRRYYGIGDGCDHLVHDDSTLIGYI